MKKCNLLFLFLCAAIFFLSSCGDKKDTPTPPKPSDPKIPTVSQFAYDGMSVYYLWADYMASKKPKTADTDAKAYFKSLLHPTDVEHGWSWITDNVDELLADFSGEPVDAFGFSPMPLWADQAQTTIVGFVKYVFPNTPAATAGLKRGEIITHANGTKLDGKNYKIMFGANGATTFTVRDQNFENPRDVTITPGKINTDPVLFSNVYEIEGKKIGYLFYTNFINNYNNSLFTAFKHFKQEGVTDLVLDLRYNTGGAISSATYLASLIAPENVVKNKETLSRMSYNDLLNKEFGEDGRSDKMGVYDDKQFQNPLNANLNLNKVYIIATRNSFSASELITFCLRPHMAVEHIGEKTGGKYTASVTFHGYKDFDKKVIPIYKEADLNTEQKNELKNWAMQPIIGRYTDKNNQDFIATNGLIPQHPIKSLENDASKWKPIGDVDDYLFAKAISLITGKPYTETRSASDTPFMEAPLFSPADQIRKEAVIIDNPRWIIVE